MEILTVKMLLGTVFMLAGAVLGLYQAFILGTIANFIGLVMFLMDLKDKIKKRNIK